MLRKALTLGIGFILAVSLLSVSMIICFTYDAEAHEEWDCTLDDDPNFSCTFYGDEPDPDVWDCVFIDHGDHDPDTGE